MKKKKEWKTPRLIIFSLREGSAGVPGGKEVEYVKYYSATNNNLCKKITNPANIVNSEGVGDTVVSTIGLCS